jgi:YHS domain-containing protein
MDESVHNERNNREHRTLTNMKSSRYLKPLLASLNLVVALMALTFAAQAEDKKETKAKPYTLDKCIVSDEKLDADPAMKSYSFVHGGQEFKLCCKSCLKDFNKNPGKYAKKLKDAEADKAKAKK